MGDRIAGITYQDVDELPYEISDKGIGEYGHHQKEKLTYNETKICERKKFGNKQRKWSRLCGEECKTSEMRGPATRAMETFRIDTIHM